MRVGIVGCGYWGAKHVRVASSLPSVSQVVIVDPRPAVRSALGADFPAALQRATLGEALDDLDAVIVATPPESHFDVAAEAIEAAKHVMVEKPMTRTVSSSADLVAMADEAGVTLAVGHTFAYNPAVWKLAELAETGRLGRLHHLDAARLNLGLYRSDVNVLWDLAAHDISISQSIVGATPSMVSAWGHRHTTPFGEDVASLRMEFGGADVESTVRVSWLDPVKVRRTTVVGSDAMVVWDDLDAERPVTVFDRGREQNPAAAEEVRYRHGDAHSPRIDPREPLRLEIEDFVDSAASGRPPIADGRDGLAVVAVLAASDVSIAENGAPVPVVVPPIAQTLSIAVA